MEIILKYMIVVLTINRGFCWRSDYGYNDNDVTRQQNYNLDYGEGHPPDYGSHYSHYSSHESDETYHDHDAFIFPDEEDKYRKNSQTARPKPQNLQSCVLSCKLNEDNEPVCGTDGVTYLNFEQLQCAMRCGIDVRLRRLSPCPGWQGTNPRSTTEPNNIETCLSRCPTTPEYNPVCGTDNVTYKNHGKLVCAQVCGVNVQLQRQFPCPKPIGHTPEPTTTSQRPNELSDEIRDCIHNCPATSEYNPVCGTNGVTYFNIGKLECAKYCGVDVTMQRKSSCNNPINTSTFANRDNINNFQTTTSNTPTTKFTIRQDVLDEVFPKEDDGNDEDIDIRNNAKF